MEKDSGDVTGSSDGEGRPPIDWPGHVYLADINTEGPPGIEIYFPDVWGSGEPIEVHEIYYSDGVVRPLLEALEHGANDPGLDQGRRQAARDALVRLRAAVGEPRR